jgi:hypothetical protein
VERVRYLLMDLFAQVLSEQGRAAPGLRNIRVEFEPGGPRLVAVFSNGRRASVALPRDDLYAFCDRYVPWSVDYLHAALTSLGRTVYAQVIESPPTQIDATALDHHEPRRARIETPWSYVARWLREWWNGSRFVREHRRSAAIAERAARDRGIQLLTKNLSPAKRAQYGRYGYFEVTGGDTGKRYRITRAYQMNVQEIGLNGKRTRSLCFVPKGGLVLGDVMLAQKLALELFESRALAVANVISGRPPTALPP